MRGYAPSSWSSISPVTIEVYLLSPSKYISYRHRSISSFDSKYVPVNVDRRIGHTTPQKVCVVDRGMEMMA